MANNRVDVEGIQYSCQLCQKSFNESSNLESHMRVHTGEKSFSCDLCQKSFSKVGHLKRHMRIHTGEKPFSCHLCQKSFSRVCHLKAHMRIHTGEKPFICQLCEKSFSEGSTLKTHMRIHTGEKPFSCQLCQKSFSVCGHLKAHMRIHTGEKPFSCQLCKKSFSVGGSLKRHTRIHTGKKPNLCQKSFAKNRDLKELMTTHSGEKQFICDVCNTRFTQCGLLKKHRMTHAIEKQHRPNLSFSKNSFSPNEFNLHARTRPHDIKIGSEVDANMSDRFLSFNSAGVTDKPNESLSRTGYTCPSGRASPLPKVVGGDSLYTSNVHAGTSLSKSFGCGLCDELFEKEKNFLEHCVNHRFSPPDDFAADFYPLSIAYTQR